ncbi:MAG TPA: TonB-dependent receptor [Chitinophagaceae bacterium]|nr:TonB-dependent receptor [Chitinophagaceae bacterium]
MKQILIISILLFTVINLNAAGSVANDPVLKLSLTGKITDAKSGEPLAGASIYLTDDKIGAIADDQGNYILNNIPSGHHVVEVSHTGYSTVVEHIELNENLTKNFQLEPVVTENQGVVITGVSGATSIRRTPVPVTLMSRTALLQTPSTNIIDALGKVPGVAQLSTGPAISKPIVRGLGYNRVVVINDGIRQEGQQWGDEHGIEVDEMSVAKAEVLKGPASLMYGSDALAGVINLITNVPVAEGVIKGNILSNYQTNNGLFGLNGNITGNKNGFNWNFYGTYKSAGNYKNKYDGKVLNSGFNEKNFGGYAGFNKSWGYSHIIFSRFDQHLGLIEGERDDATGEFILFGGSPLERVATDEDLSTRDLFVPKQRVQHNKIISDNNFAIGQSRLKINLGYQQNIRQEFGNAEDPEEKELYFDLGTFNYSVHWQLPEMKEWHTTIGVSGMSQSNKNKGAEVLIPEYNLFDAGGFVYTQRFFDKVTLSGGLRLDNRNVNSKELIEGMDVIFPSFKKSFSNFSGSAGLTWSPQKKIVLKFNVARGFRAPTLAELASNGAHEGTNRYEYGNLDLKSEKSFQTDAGFELSEEHFNLSLSTFYNRINDFIFYNKLNSVFGGDSLVFSDGENIPSYKFNQNDAKLYGMELTLDIHPHPLDWLHFENSFSFVRGKFDNLLDNTKSGSYNLPLIPAPVWKSELRGNFIKAGKVFQNLYAKMETATTFKQDHPFTGFDTETPTSGYTILNAGLGADILSKKKTIFSIHVGLLNLTDVAWQSHLSRLKYTDTNNLTGRTGVFNAGRNFSIKVNIPLDFSGN